MGGWLKRLLGKTEEDAYMEAGYSAIDEALVHLEEARVQTSKKAQAAGLYSSDVEALFSAARDCDLERIRTLLSSKPQLATFSDSDGSTALLELAKFSLRNQSTQLAIAKLLLDAGADADSRNTFGTTPLQLAAGGTNLDLVRLLISRGADVRNTNRAGAGPIHHADYPEMLQLLLENGADINARRKDGQTLLALWLFNHMEDDEFALFIKARGGTQ